MVALVVTIKSYWTKNMRYNQMQLLIFQRSKLMFMPVQKVIVIGKGWVTGEQV